jgi:hypothetical protein
MNNEKIDTNVEGMGLKKPVRHPNEPGKIGDYRGDYSFTGHRLDHASLNRYIKIDWSLSVESQLRLLLG